MRNLTITHDSSDNSNYEWWEVDGIQFDDEDDAKFFVLAKQAFDVMTRRGWYAFPTSLVTAKTWNVQMAGVSNTDRREWMKKGDWPDPFTALVEADRWYKENIEKV